MFGSISAVVSADGQSWAVQFGWTSSIAFRVSSLDNNRSRVEFLIRSLHHRRRWVARTARGAFVTGRDIIWS